MAEIGDGVGLVEIDEIDLRLVLDPEEVRLRPHPADYLPELFRRRMQTDLQDGGADAEEGEPRAASLHESRIRLQCPPERLDQHDRPEADRGKKDLVGLRILAGRPHLFREARHDLVEALGLAPRQVGREGPVGKREIEIEIIADEAHQEREGDEGEKRRRDRRVGNAEHGREDADGDRADGEEAEDQERVDHEQAVPDIGAEIALYGPVPGEFEERAVAGRDPRQPGPLHVGRHHLVPAQDRVARLRRPARSVRRHVKGDLAPIRRERGLGAYGPGIPQRSEFRQAAGHAPRQHLRRDGLEPGYVDDMPLQGKRRDRLAHIGRKTLRVRAPLRRGRNA